SAGWVMSEENFLSGIKPLSFLKLRASYGIVGNAEIGNFPQLGLYQASNYGGTAGQVPTQIGNPNLQWETNKQFDIGLDFGFLNNRITGEIDWYQRNSEDLLLNVNIPQSTGFGTVVRNLGTMENKGFEFVLNTQNTVGEFKWSTSLNLSTNRGKILDIEGQIIEGGVGGLNRAMEGQPLGVFYTVEYAGVNPDNGDAQFYKNELKADGTMDNDVSVYGMGQYSMANMIYEDNQTADQMNRWQKPGDITNVPQVRYWVGNGNQRSSRFIVDGSFVRLRTASIGYTLPKSITDKVKIDRLRIYVSGMNLYTWTNNYPLWDPEVNADSFDSNISKGNDFYTPPQPRTILFGVNVGF
nr:TonB-dependent receptor [Chitinophagaceae bacterium]